MLKEVNKISKFFEKNNQLTKTKDMGKSYVPTSMREVFKIKEIFPNLQAKKLKKHSKNHQ